MLTRDRLEGCFLREQIEVVHDLSQILGFAMLLGYLSVIFG